MVARALATRGPRLVVDAVSRYGRRLAIAHAIVDEVLTFRGSADLSTQLSSFHLLCGGYGLVVVRALRQGVLRRRDLAGLLCRDPKRVRSLLERARREALLRMTESAREQGYDAVFNVRLETSRLANARGDGNGTAGVEMLAFGTAVKFAG